ncbi:hypothetical protein [Streptomyces sp. NPDC007088]|uniref:hypothetical protein n=1 Tax=Streptomyces sp. NPDC007088 TaxID=3364773 RepID=UPI0036D00A68
MSHLRPECGRTAPRLLAPLFAVLLALGAVLASAPGARAAGVDVRAAAEALRQDPVYVDPAMRDQFSKAGERDLENRIKDAGRSVFVAVLPPGGADRGEVLGDLRSRTGIAGVYALRYGTEFTAGADSRVMSRAAVGNAVRTVRGESLTAQLDDFTGIALRTATGAAPASWGADGAGGAPVAPLVVVGAVVVLGAGGVYLVSRGRRRRREQERHVALERLRTVVDEDITAFGEELDRLDFHPAEPGADDTRRADYERALNAYDQAKSLMAAARAPEDVRAVTQALEEGRFSLATLEARRTGAPLPDRRPPCFFDPRHGPSVADAEWAPAGGTPREIPVCAADRARLDDGAPPMVRTVATPGGERRPYWDAGPAYGPWAGGYFGGGLLPGLLLGTALGGVMATPAYGAEYGYGYGDFDAQNGYEGGDVTGSDFDPGDFGGGGDGFGGGFGGGDGFGGGNNSDFGGGF